MIPPVRARLSLSKIFPAVLFFGLLAMTARPAVDPDLWWHLRTGQWIMETGHIPHVDPFSFTRAGNPWVAHEWLSEVTFYGIWKYSGEAGLIIFSAIATTAGFMLLYLRSLGKASWTAAVVTPGAPGFPATWGVRPQMFTFALASLLLWLLESGGEKPRLLLWIPPLFLLWLNLHAGFAFGPVLLVAFCLGLIAESAIGETPWTKIRPRLFHVLLVLMACVALVPLNPSGAQLYRYPLDVLRSAGMRSFIIEWFPPDFHQLHYLPLFLIWLALLGALASSRNRPKARVLVPFLMTFFAALDAVRHIPLLEFTATPVIAAAFCGLSSWKQISSPPKAGSVDRVRLAFPAAILLLIAAFALTRWSVLVRQQATTEAEVFPPQAVEFLHAHTIPNRLFVYYDWGGYLILKLYPQYRVFMDGRADLYGDDLLRQFQKASQLRDGWEQVLDRWRVEAVLVPPSGALAQSLLLDDRWHVEFRDSHAILFLSTPRSTKVAGCRESYPAGHKAKKCVPDPSESAKLHATRISPTAARNRSCAQAMRCHVWGLS